MDEAERMKMVDGVSELFQNPLAIILEPRIGDSLLVALKADTSDTLSIPNDALVLHDMRVRLIAEG